MTDKKNILGICGSASQNSANLFILKTIASLTGHHFEIMENLHELPSFRTELTDSNTPEVIVTMRKKIADADGVIICTPEYILSIPGSLKMIFEWCVSTTVFLNKPSGLITASANGHRGHQELQIIMQTLQADFCDKTSLLIPGVKGLINERREIQDKDLLYNLEKFIKSFEELISH